MHQEEKPCPHKNQINMEIKRMTSTLISVVNEERPNLELGAGGTELPILMVKAFHAVSDLMMAEDLQEFRDAQLRARCCFVEALGLASRVSLKSL